MRLSHLVQKLDENADMNRLATIQKIEDYCKEVEEKYKPGNAQSYASAAIAGDIVRRCKYVMNLVKQTKKEVEEQVPGHRKSFKYLLNQYEDLKYYTSMHG